MLRPDTWRARTLLSAVCGVLGIAGQASAQTTEPPVARTLVPSSPPFIYQPSPNALGGAAGLIGVINQYNGLRDQYKLDRHLSDRRAEELRELQSEADRTGKVECQKYRTTYTFQYWGHPPIAARLDKATNGPEFRAPAGNFVDGLSAEGQRLEYQSRYLTHTTFDEFCAYPTLNRWNLPAVNSQFTSQLAGQPYSMLPLMNSTPAYSLLAPSPVIGPSLMNNGFGQPQYSLGLNLQFGNDALSWQHSMAQQYPLLATPLPLSAPPSRNLAGLGRD